MGRSGTSGILAPSRVQQELALGRLASSERDLPRRIDETSSLHRRLGDLGGDARGGAALVARFGSNVPSWDEWDMVPTLTGEQPVSAEWLWSQHNEHRVPLPRLVLLAVNLLGGPDFRIAQVLNGAGLCLVLLPLCGANGVALVLAMALWLAYVATLELRARETARGSAALVFALASVALTGLYFVGFERVPTTP